MSTPLQQVQSARLSRVVVVERLAAALADHRWAFQGTSTAVSRWVADRGMGDLDLWVARESMGAVHEVLTDLGGVLVCSTANPDRLMHRQYWMPTVNLADDASDEMSLGSIVDLTVGDLKVGPTLLVAERDVDVHLQSVACDVSTSVRGPVLRGVARVADLAVRPLLRGRVVDGARLRDASVEFRSLTSPESAQLTVMLRRVVGGRHVVDVQNWLRVGESSAAMADVRDRARRRFARATLSPKPLVATWTQRAIVLPTRRKGPVGMRSRGVTVALVGTDGSGKSTTAERLAADLRAAGFTVEHQYFGMARGNLPGVGLIRRLAGGGNTTAAPSAPASSGSAAHAPGLLRQAASWVYVVDYWWRSVRRVRPAVRRGHVVICDRWVSDLRRHPVPDSPAARVAERLVGSPDLFVLADAPAEEMVARKPERTVDEAAAEQASLRQVGLELAGRPVRRGGRCVFITVDTSAATATPAAERIVPLVGAIVTAAHRVLPHDEPSVEI